MAVGDTANAAEFARVVADAIGKPLDTDGGGAAARGW